MEKIYNYLIFFGKCVGITIRSMFQVLCTRVEIVHYDPNCSVGRPTNHWCQTRVAILLVCPRGQNCNWGVVLNSLGKRHENACYLILFFGMTVQEGCASFVFVC